MDCGDGDGGNDGNDGGNDSDTRGEERRGYAGLWGVLGDVIDIIGDLREGGM